MFEEIHSLLRLGLENEPEALDSDLDATKWVPSRQTPRGKTGRTSSARWEPPSLVELQAALPQYEISAFLARGGMGAVYLGVQQALQRPVAIKVLPPDMADDGLQFAARFKQEAQAMARLSHPNIVTVFDAGQTAGGLLYFVMEYVEGTDVARLIAAEGRIEQARAVELLRGVCDALAFAHGEGIVHRDIKPANVMLDKRGRVKVADFGLAKTTNLQSSLVTGSHMALGTSDFIAPEALIPGLQVDGRADIYAVGVMLYQMLTGHIPRGRFSPPSCVVARVSPRLDGIVDRSLQTNRDLRYSTASHLKADLELAGAALSRREGPGSRPKLRLAAWVVLTVMIASGLGYGIWRSQAPTVASDQKTIASARPVVPPAFPRGQWVSPFDRATDINPSWFQAGATWNGGWITPGAGTNDSITLGAPNGRGKNWGVRARYLWTGRGGANLVLRRRGSSADNTVEAYEFRVEPRSVYFRRVKAHGLGGGREFIALGTPAPPEIPKDQDYVIEAYVIGNKLYGRVNGQVFTALADDALHEGSFEAASAQMLYRDIEFINLDGLSEAEALKFVALDSVGSVSAPVSETRPSQIAPLPATAR